MLKKLFGRGKQEPERAPIPAAAPAGRVSWEAPAVPFADYFNLHLHDVSLDEAEAAIRERYLIYGEAGEPGAVLARDGAWVTAFIAPATMRGVGFNRLASQIARELDCWVIGYRVFAGQGLDVHYFHGSEHVDQLAATDSEIEFEPETAGLFAHLAEVSHVIPRPAARHPLDFHVDLLAALGITTATLDWEAALARQASDETGMWRLLRVQP